MAGTAIIVIPIYQGETARKALRGLMIPTLQPIVVIESLTGSPLNLNTPDSSQTQILERFFFDWSTHADIPSGHTVSWYSSLPQIYFNSRPDSLLHKSVNALASASYGQRFNSNQTLRDAAKLYGEAIRMLKDTMLGMFDSSQYCEVMSSIMLLGIYEGLVDQSVALEGSWVSHISGGCTLLNLRGQDKIIECPAEYEVSILIFMQMIHIGLVTGQGLSISWASVKELCLPRLPYFYAHTQLIYQSARLCMEWRTALLTYETDQDITQLSAITSQALTLDKELEEWATSVPPSSTYAVESMTDTEVEWLQPLLNTSWRPHNSHTYSSLTNQILWRFYWMVRTILNQALLFTNGIFEQSKVGPKPILCQAEIESRLLSFTDRLCESCLSTFINIVKQGPQYCRAEGIPSVLGYLTLQVFPTLALCLEQVNLAGVDLSGRKEWVASMRHFLRVNLGIAKGPTVIPISPNSNIPVQIWGNL
ncbi:hypothetical protein FPOAC1_010137 [Fusarium poae]|uniref:hypothetical protein n=1 Tax=Fusarium poae TaxID=36050 RepID=UPI001CEAFC29|nr:hypothetical protein FPOAC1_010137 [Fusarium poae]KAG8665342.1 hypothetical protein FPOAC1_010137 [Fusarium poae]